jgi:hypothetical protein
MDMISFPETIDWHKHRRIPLFPARCRRPDYDVAPSLHLEKRQLSLDHPAFLFPAKD